MTSLELVSPGAITDGVTPTFPEKKLTTFLVIAVCKVITFLAVVSSQLPPSDLVRPLFFLNSATYFFYFIRVSPPEGVTRGGPLNLTLVSIA